MTNCGVPGSVLSARRVTRAVAPLLLAGLALGACSDDEPTAAPSSSTSTSVTTSVTPTPTPTVTATPTSATPTPTPTKATATPTRTSTPTRTTPACAAAGAPKVNTTGMSAEGAATARKLHAAATACDARTLIALAKADTTGLVGDQAPSAVFTSTSAKHYSALATLLSMPPAESFDGTLQPKVFSEQFAQSDSEWDKVIAAGLLTRAQATKMRQDDGGYTGYRVGISGDGTWTFFTTGR